MTEKLFQAIESGDIKNIVKELEICPDINTKNEGGYTPLMEASFKGNLEIVKLILEHSPDVNIQSYQGSTAIMIACHSGFVEIAKLILSHNCDINLKNEYGYNAIMAAIDNGHTETTELLLQNTSTASLSEKNNKGENALNIATRGNYTEIIKLLIGTKIDINNQDEFGCTPLHNAVLHRNTEAVKLLLGTDINIDLQDEYGDTAFLLACFEGLNEIAGLIFTKDPDLSIANNNEVTAIDFLEMSQNYEILDLIEQQNTKIQEKELASTSDYAMYEPKNVPTLYSFLRQKVTAVQKQSRKNSQGLFAQDYFIIDLGENSNLIKEVYIDDLGFEPKVGMRIIIDGDKVDLQSKSSILSFYDDDGNLLFMAEMKSILGWKKIEGNAIKDLIKTYVPK